MPPTEAVVDVIRWAKARRTHFKIIWIAQILPLDRFVEICRRVCFAIEDYTEVEYIIANGFLSHLFAEHVVATGTDGYLDLTVLSRENMENALARLPLLAPASIEMITALTLGCLNAIESSRSTLAWTCISTAANMCQTLGLHKAMHKGGISSLGANLFSTVYKLEKGVALRLGRSSRIRDEEITLSFGVNESASIRLARIQGQTYESLYSPTALVRPDAERRQIVLSFSLQIKSLMEETSQEIERIREPKEGRVEDPMRVLYLNCYQMCQSSLLAMILRAGPTDGDGLVSEECLIVARDALERHRECLSNAKAYGRNAFLVVRYLGWAVMNTPFLSFNILFTHTVQTVNVDDLARIEHFATTLRPDGVATGSLSHPYRLYDLLCKTARAYIQKLAPQAQVQLDSESERTDLMEFLNPEAFDLENWYQGNQQMIASWSLM